MKKFETLYLHVGLEKTGTTSIQRAMQTHRKKLEELGYYYPEAIAVGRNALFGAMFDERPDRRAAFKIAIDKAGGQDNLIEDITGQFDREFKNTQASNLILSSEFLAAHSDIGNLKAYCDELAEKTIIILYLREQSSLRVSLHSTRVKGGGTEFGKAVPDDKSKLPWFLDFRFIVQRLEQHYDRSQLIVRLFDREELEGGDAIKDFLTLIGLGEHTDEFEIERQNESLSRDGLNLLKVVNNYSPIIIDGERNHSRQVLIDDMLDLDQTGDFGKTALSEKEIRQIWRLTNESNEWVRKNYFSDREKLFNRVLKSGNMETSEQDTLDYAGRLLSRAYRRIWELERKSVKANKTIEKLKARETSAVQTAAPSVTSPLQGLFGSKKPTNIRRLIIHIGRHKSGTTAVQHYLNLNRFKLDRAGILYPSAGRARNAIAHHNLARSADKGRVKSTSEFPKYAKEIFSEVAPHHHTAIISSEAFQELRSVSRLKSLIKHFPGAQVEIVCYFREFTDYMMSAFRQATQNQSRFRTFDMFLSHQYDIVKSIREWESLGTLRMKWFHKTTLENGDIIQDFCKFAEIDQIGNVKEIPKDLNVSIGGNLLFFKLGTNYAKKNLFTYRQLADLALEREAFRQPFFVMQERIEWARGRNDYNEILESRLGPAPVRAWENYKTLPDFPSLQEDRQFVQDRIAGLDLSEIMDLAEQARGWF